MSQHTPKLTQSMTMHLNGGSNYSEFQYEVFADGKPTGIRRTTRTDGSPEHLKTVDVFWKGDEFFDVLETKGVGMMNWLTAHLPSTEKGPTP